MAVVQEEMVTSAVIAMLSSALGVPVGDHGAFDSSGAAIDTSSRYALVHRIDGGGVSGSWGDPHEDLTIVYQVDACGRSRPQAEGLARLVAAVMTDIAPAGGHVHPLSGTGWVGGLRERQMLGMPSPEGLDEQGNVGVWVQRERFEVAVHRA